MRHHWRTEAEIRGGNASTASPSTYRDHFLTRWPNEYQEITTWASSQNHERALQVETLFMEALDRVSQVMCVDVRSIVESRLRQMHQVSRPLMSMADILDLEGDQYLAYDRVTSKLSRHQPGRPGFQAFITGPGGTGKSYLLKAFEQYLTGRRKTFLKMAPTGIAACNIEGQTIHAALSLRASDTEGLSFLTSIFQHEEQVNELRKIQVLIIDEISMVSAGLLTYISTYFSKIHKNSLPFGGLHVLAFGDLMQLPPVKGLEVFYSRVWKVFVPVFLNRSRRHNTDTEFGTLLLAVRMGRMTDNQFQSLHNRFLLFSWNQVVYESTLLVSYRQDARKLNDLMLEKCCPFESVTHSASDRQRGQLINIAQSQKSFKRETNLPEEVVCTAGARVMFLTNQHIDKGISNGSCGLILSVDDDGMPTVVFPRHDRILVCTWVLYNALINCWLQELRVVPITCTFQINGIPYSRTQLPIQNAFALTVHKTQGLTLSNVTISFDCSMFASGHAYTALSRAQRMDQVQISALDRDAFKVDSDAVQEYARLEAQAAHIWG